jgi:hypothetical protein
LTSGIFVIRFRNVRFKGCYTLIICFMRDTQYHSFFWEDKNSIKSYIAVLVFPLLVVDEPVRNICVAFRAMAVF